MNAFDDQRLQTLQLKLARTNLVLATVIVYLQRELGVIACESLLEQLNQDENSEEAT